MQMASKFCMNQRQVVRMSRLDDTLNEINFRYDYPHNGTIESLFRTIAINSAIICDKLDTISNQLKGVNYGKRRNS